MVPACPCRLMACTLSAATTVGVMACGEPWQEGQRTRENGQSVPQSPQTSQRPAPTGCLPQMRHGA